MSVYCVEDEVNITVSTNQSQSLDNAITLSVNDRVCSDNNSDSDVVTCNKSSDVIDDSSSFTLTAVNSGSVIIRAHTNYYGANWFSHDKRITVVDNCTDSKS